MPEINIDLNFCEHRKTRKLARVLGRGAEAVLIRLWTYTGKYHAEDGHLGGYSAEEVASILDWRGKDAVQTLIDTGWLHVTPTGYQVHEWLEYQGHIAAYKAKGKAMAEKRWKKPNTPTNNAGINPNSNAASNAASIPDSNARAERAELTERAERAEQTPTHPPDAHIPTWDEVWSFANMRGVSEESALGFFDFHQGKNMWLNKYNRLINWQHEVVTWWRTDQANGGPRKHGTNNQRSKPGVDRNAGTCNEGLAAEYDLKKIQAARALRQQKQPGA